MADPRTAERRPVSYASFDDLARDLDLLEAAHRAGTLRHTANWTAGQNLEHCAILMECALDGFPSNAPWLFRKLARAMFLKAALSGKPAKAGYKLPKQASFLLPRDSVPFDEGAARVRRVIERLKAGDRFTHPSPVFEKLTHDEWSRLQLGHCALHLSFLHPN
ncbi:MAG: DUF1569 domain-containing protein [Phycisphaerales bacterium]|jgi:hypothetical protein|nr:DUF1569 domain-containing protein [Phycisphaerales bacterium]